MSFEQEARANADSRGFLNRLSRRQLLSEVAKSTRDQLGVSIKKIRAELHVNEITNWIDNVEGMKVGGAESVFEPDGNEVKVFNMFEQPYPGSVYTKEIGGNLYRYMQIPDAYKVEEAKYPTRETRVCNPTKTAMFFDGLSAHVDLGADTAVWSKTINKFTLRVRIRATEIPITLMSFRNVLSINDGVDGEITLWFDAGPSFLIGIGTASGGQTISLNNEEEVNDTAKWYDILVTYDKDAGANNFKLYVDGVLKGIETHTGALQFETTTKFWLGRYEFDSIGTNQYKGYMADFMFWSNAALVQADVTNITNGDIHKVTVPDYWLPLNDGITDPTDIVSGTKTGTMNDGAVYQTIEIDDDKFVWVKNGITGSYPVMLRTGYSLGLNLTTVNSMGVTRRRNGQFLTFNEENWFSTFDSFNGTSDFISEPDKASLDLSVFTVACIFRTSDDTSGGILQFLINKGDYQNGGAGQNLNYSLEIFNNCIVGEFQTATSVSHTVGIGKKAVNDGKWHVAVLIYNGSFLTLYLDGAVIDSQSTSDTPDVTADPLVIGRFSGASSNFFEGDIAETIVWNTGISDAQAIEYCWTGKLGNPGAIVFTDFMGTTSFDGIDDGVAVADSAALDLLQFSIAARFRSRRSDYSSTAMLVNKGGEGSDTAGQNMNYGIWLTASEFVQGGFEEGSGTNREAISPLKYADNELHTAIITYDQVNLRLYIDGILVHAPATTQTPEVNALDLRLGKNARTDAFYFMGEIVFAYVWNNDLTLAEVRNMINNGVIPQTGAIVYSNLLGAPHPYDIISPMSDFNWEAQNFSESIWFYASDLTNTGKKRVMKIYTLDANNYHSYMIDNADNKLFIEFVKAGTPTRLESTVAVTANTWHHLAVTWEFGTPTVKGRLDDVAMVGSAKVGHAAISYHKPVYGGYPRMMYHEQFMGMIDAHIYYKHDTVLTTGEMTNLKNYNTKYSINASRDPAVSGAFMSA